jgi:Putative beta-barrel porin 2
LSLGPVTLRPGITLSYVDADVAGLTGPTPVRDRYLQTQPGLTAEMPFLDGKLQASYEPRFRSFSSYPVVGTTTHMANAALELPVGTSLTLRGSEHFAHGVLETTEVDPGREYFFALGRFTRWNTDLGARWELGGRLGLDLGAGWNQVSFDSASSFFPYSTYSLRAGLAYEVTPNLHAVLGYTYDRVPRPDQRPLVESTAHSVGLSLKGEITPLLTGQIEVAYRDQTSPLAAAGGQSFRGLTTGVSLKKEFRPDTWLDLFVSRATDPSAFEQNAFYVATAVQGGVTVPVPFSCSFRGGAGYQWNTYQTIASAIGVPREDTIFAWSVGLGRPLGSRAFLRGDYRRERRDSNLREFTITTHSLIVQLGIGLFGAAASR